ncbi:MAG: hypothetical protein ACRERC_14725 [Candidatus Binatia bacterium]
MNLSPIEWLNVIVLGGLMGALGQGARVVVGIKKLADEATAKQETTGSLIEPARILTSVFIGAIAGALAALLAGIDPAAKVSMQQVLGLAAAGYTGADFIEGFVSRNPLAAAPAEPKAAPATLTLKPDEYLG